MLTWSRGIGYALINFFICYSMQGNSLDKHGNTESIWLISVSIFTNILFIVNIKILVVSKYMTLLTIVSVFGSLLIYFIFAVHVHYWDFYNSFASMQVSFFNPRFYLNLLFISGITIVFDILTYSFNIIFSDSYESRLMILRNSYGKLDSMEIMPNSIKNCISSYSLYEINTNNDYQAEKIPLLKSINYDDSIFNKKYLNIVKPVENTRRRLSLKNDNSVNISNKDYYNIHFKLERRYVNFNKII
jgi:hypothetical protein